MVTICRPPITLPLHLKQSKRKLFLFFIAVQMYYHDYSTNASPDSTMPSPDRTSVSVAFVVGCVGGQGMHCTAFL